MSNPLAKRFNFLSMLAFTAPTIIMMVFMSMYSMVDGAFVSRYVGTAALSAVNIAYPLMSIVIALGVMLGTGGSAVVATQMGVGKQRDALENFSLLTVVAVSIGAAVSLLGYLFLDPLVSLLGANAAIYDYCRDYILWLLPFGPSMMLQMLFQTFFVTAGKPIIGLAATVTGGIANIFLDYLLIVPMGMGISGAAIATGIGASIPAVFGLCYFALCRRGHLYLVRPKLRLRVLWESSSNGASEMVSNLAAAVTTYLFNIIMMRLIGEDGVAAITIVLYSQFFLSAVYLGFSNGVAPVVSYNYGDGNIPQLKRLFRNSLFFILGSSVLMFGLALAASGWLVQLFAKDSPAVTQLALEGFRIFSASYLFMGVNIFASSLFTALSNGKVSAIISFLRTFVFIVAAVLLLPQAIGLTGVWLAVPLAELLALAVSLWYILRLRGHYHYA